MKISPFALAALLFAGLPLASSPAQINISVGIAPPLLPIVEQPFCPVDGYLWTPGYWGYGNLGYYWTPGVWVAPPQVGFLWTPPYWGFNNGAYAFNEGYWGPTVGFYGGINYGYGYFGNGFYGGQWAGNSFRYNTAVMRVNTNVIHNTYADRTVLQKQATSTRASFNGPGGVKAEATAEQKAAQASRVPPTSEQISRREAASKNRALQDSVNHGHPSRGSIQALDQRGSSGATAERGKLGANGPANEKAQRAQQRERIEGASGREAAAERDRREETRGARAEDARRSEVTSQAREHRNGARAIYAAPREPLPPEARQRAVRGRPEGTRGPRKKPAKPLRGPDDGR